MVLAPATGIGQQSSSSQPLLFTVPTSSGGVTSLLTPSSNLRIVNTGGNKTLATVVASSSAGTGTSQPVRLMSPTKTITLQQAQQLGLITSPKKVETTFKNYFHGVWLILLNNDALGAAASGQ